jgi:hypothetical protein
MFSFVISFWRSTLHATYGQAIFSDAFPANRDIYLSRDSVVVGVFIMAWNAL